MNSSLENLLLVIEHKMDAHVFQKASPELTEKGKMAEFEKDLRGLATQGSIEARLFIKSRIIFILATLQEYVNVNTIDKLIEEYHINYFKNIFTGEITNKSCFKNQVDKEIAEYFSRFSISETASFDVKLDKLSQICYQEIFGYSVLDELIFESELNEVACNRHDYIWIQYKGIKRKIPNKSFSFESRERYEVIVENRLTSTAGVEMNNGQPVIYSILENGSRVTALRPPLSRYFTVSIRLFNDGGNGNESKFDWTTSNTNRNVQQTEGTSDNKLFDMLKVLIKKGRRNVAIIGEQGSGKTTIADRIVIRNLDDDLSIGLAENVHELDISRKYPDKNIIELQYGSNFTPSDVMEIFFRLNRDVVIFGEVRNHFEAFEMLKAMLRQARGSLFTFHSSSVKRMVHDLRQLLIQTGYYKDFKEAQFDVADAVDIIIQVRLDRKTGERYIYRVCELVAIEDTMSFRINELFIYDRDEGVYLINKNGLDKVTIEDCLCYELTKADADYLRDIFVIKPDEATMYRYIDDYGEGDLFNVYEN